MQRVAIAVFASVLVLSSAGTAQSRANFSGMWKMDVSRSESAHQDVPIGPITLNIRQTADEFSIETQRTDAKSAAVTSDTLRFKLDGKETTEPGKPSVPVKVKAHWDGARLITETEREVDDSTVTQMQIFTLSANGKEITIDKTLTVQHGYQSPGAARTTGRGKDVFVKTK